jgi:hypothetical protein
VCAPKIKGFETPFKSDQLPAKTKQNQPQNNGAQSKSGIVPKINKKMKKKWRIRKKLGFGICWGKKGKSGCMVADGGAKRLVVVRWVVGK